MRKHPIGLIIMTALVPTIGHQYMIEMAAEYMDELFGELHVIVFDRTFEPVNGALRASAISEQFKHMSHVKVHHHVDDGAPQNDDGTKQFWDYWCDLAYKITSQDNFTHVFASEVYGNTYAEHLGAEFVPVDVDREVYRVKGTDVRRNLDFRFDEVMPAFKKYLARRVVFFGAESTGKTTMARKFAEDPQFKGQFLPEWARPYLERFGPEVTDARMKTITLAQFASQRAVVRNLRRPWVYQDTDLLSTIGYYRIYGGKQYEYIEHLFEQTKGNLYIVMNSGIPFAPDPLRYGGEVRETPDQFWIDLLEEYGCNYYVVKSAAGTEEQFAEIAEVVAKFQNETFSELVGFERD